MAQDDNKLKKYKSKRDFQSTPEPQGGRKKDKNKPIFVIQKHDATALHYDFRLENQGVLLSWAVPKGLPEDTSEKHLAIRTEDHPIDYAKFEGVIPEGNYGAGTVEIIDSGTFTNLKDKPLEKNLEDGELLFQLHGHKYKSVYALIRFKNTQKRSKQEEWLFIKTKIDPEA